MCDLLKPPVPVYWRYDYSATGVLTPIVEGEAWYREYVKRDPLLRITYVNCTSSNRILYVGSGNSKRPFARHHRGIHSPPMSLFKPGEDFVIEVLAVTRWQFLAKVLESLICELAAPPLNKVRHILPTNRHLCERNLAVEFWNNNYASRFGIDAPYPYGARGKV